MLAGFVENILQRSCETLSLPRSHEQKSFRLSVHSFCFVRLVPLHLLKLPLRVVCMMMILPSEEIVRAECIELK